MKSELMWKDNLKSIGTNIPRTVPNDIYMAMSSIVFYTKTINALVKIGWSYNGTDGVVAGFHNARAEKISFIEGYDNHKYLVHIWNDSSVHLYDRQLYLKNRYGKKWEE